MPFSSLTLTGPRLSTSPCRSPVVVVSGGSLRWCPASAVLCCLLPLAFPNDLPDAAVLIVYTEGLTRAYYSSRAPSVGLQLANAFKVGLEYGLFVDAFKLST